MKHGRSYEASVKEFSPYAETKEVNEEARGAAVNLVKGSLQATRKGTFLYVNNRLEGNAPNTIATILARAFLPII
ncbi:MAG TPA: hypothetical protein VMF06_14715 [Candidatus Limnocylindria bacterium]|nr:hypothetical protein [Candidatus Limnocylindria bacterium]